MKQMICAMLAMLICLNIPVLSEQPGVRIDLKLPGADAPAYVVRVVDQNGDPVAEAAVGFCLDTGCVPVETDANGMAAYDGAPAQYHIQVVDTPEGYDYPDDSDFTIGPEPGEITLMITKEPAAE